MEPIHSDKKAAQNMKLKGKTALITGGNSGIGLATARLFVAEGARVAITGRNQATLDAAAKELGQDAIAVRADVLDSKACGLVFSTIKEQFGYLDIVFANAGIAIIGSIEETSEAMFDEVLRTNLTGVFVTIKAALPLFRPGASIILNGSIAATTGTPAMGSYPASKAGLRAMSRSFAAELSSRGIRVNLVVPGPINTPIWERVSVPSEEIRDGFRKTMLGAVPLDRFGEAEEVAKAVLFLASDDSSYIQGSEIVVDGGITGSSLGAPVYR
jgi:NAD(P)-dependent dehydrogenase (short-subunit alcohol dehydrogenase family)